MWVTGLGAVCFSTLGAEDVMFIRMSRGRWDYKGVLERGSG